MKRSNPNEKVSVYGNLYRLNRLPKDEAVRVFLKCCDSKEWAERMAAARPFPMLDHLFREARSIWNSLGGAGSAEALDGDGAEFSAASFANSKDGVIFSVDGAKVVRFPPRPALRGTERSHGLGFAVNAYFKEVEKRLASVLEQ